jgi:small subunit ribosomal protein S9
MSKIEMVYSGLGRRKEAVARVHLHEGQGEDLIKIKGKADRSLQNYFSVDPSLCKEIYRPFEALNKKMIIVARVNGGGFNSQAEAMRLAISKALLKISPGYKLTLRGFGLLSNDSRKVEKKKIGRIKARKKKSHPKR